MSAPPTRAMARVLEAITRLTDGGVAPSYDELCHDLGINKSGLHRHLTALRERGLVTWMDGRARSLTVTAKPSNLDHMPTERLVEIRTRIVAILQGRGA